MTTPLSSQDRSTKLIWEARNLIIYIVNFQSDIQRAANAARRAPSNKQLRDELQRKVARLSRIAARSSSRYSRRVSNQ